MAFAVGSKTGLSYVAETVFNTIPGVPSMKAVRAKFGTNFELKRDTFQTKEVDATRQVKDLRYGNKQLAGELPFELSYSAHDDFFEALLGGTWTTNVLKVGNTLRSFTFEQQVSEIGVYEYNTGCCINTMSLSVKPNAIVEGSFGIIGADQRVAQTTGANIAVDSGAKTFTRISGSFITDGFKNGDKILTAGFTNAGNNGTFTITTITATVITCSGAAGLVTEASAAGRTIGLGTLGAASAAPSNSPFDSFTGTISEGGSGIGYVTGLELSIDNQLGANFALMSDSAQQITQGVVNITGTMNVYFPDQVLKKKFINGTDTSLQFTLGSGSATSYTFNMGTVSYTSNKRDYNEGAIIENIGFQATYDSGDASTLKITRIP